MKFSRFSLLIISGLLFLASCKKSDTINPPGGGGGNPTNNENDAINLGNPTNAATNTATPENFLKNNIYYKLAYSKNRGIPVWTAWHLESADLGTTPRQDDFRADTDLPAGWYQVQSNSYSGSGFDRGHCTPSADRTSTVAANSSTFLMTNMIPQAPTLNQGPWAGLEDFIRNSLVSTNNEAYIVMGNFGLGGTNSSGALVNNIAGGNVAVPSIIWKVVVSFPKGSNDLGRLHSDATVLTVLMPNNNSIYTAGNQNAWRNFVVTVNTLESQANAAGVPLNLFQNLADSIRTAMKGKLFQ